jgi:hypothetical protein
MYGNLNTPKHFVVPSTDDDDTTSDWPIETRGLKLGVILNNIRNNGSFADHHDELIEMGVNFDSRKVSNRFVSRAVVEWRDVCLAERACV